MLEWWTPPPPTCPSALQQPPHAGQAQHPKSVTPVGRFILSTDTGHPQMFDGTPIPAQSCGFPLNLHFKKNKTGLSSVCFSGRDQSDGFVWGWAPAPQAIVEFNSFGPGPEGRLGVDSLRIVRPVSGKPSPHSL